LTTPARNSSVYRDTPRHTLQFSVTSPQWWLIRTGFQSQKYLQQISECLARYPAEKVALIPDNPGLYPLLGLNNPFATDWWLAAERTGDFESKTSQAISDLNSHSHWLVLFQSYAASSLSDFNENQVGQTGASFFHVDSDSRLIEQLQGTQVTCGSFLGIYRP
jgi:hypothetical protein